MATIYVSDVLDQVAGTIEVQGWEAQYGPPETVYEHTWVRQGLGELDVGRWLHGALIALIADMAPPRSEGRNAAGPMGVPHTLSERCDTDESAMGWTAVGGPGGGDGTVPQSGSAQH